MKSKQSSKTDLQVVSIFKKAMSRLFMKRVGRQRLKLESDRKRFHLKRQIFREDLLSYKLFCSEE